MIHLSTEAKKSLVAKVLSGTESIRALAAANGIGYSSLQRWVYQVRKTADFGSLKWPQYCNLIWPHLGSVNVIVSQ